MSGRSWTDEQFRKMGLPPAAGEDDGQAPADLPQDDPAPPSPITQIGAAFRSMAAAVPPAAGGAAGYAQWEEETHRSAFLPWPEKYGPQLNKPRPVPTAAEILNRRRITRVRLHHAVPEELNLRRRLGLYCYHNDVDVPSDVVAVALDRFLEETGY